MKLSVNWLKQFVPGFDNDEVNRIAERMSISLTEVDEIYEIGKELDKIIASEIIEIINHPKIDSLRIVIVNTGTQKLEVVCGATNIKVGNIVPLALPQAFVYNPKSKSSSNETVRIETKEIGGIKSEGMLCSEKELGLGIDHTGIYILPDDTPLGTRIDNLIRDTVIEIENKALTHRPDCFSHVGIAREIAVQNNHKFVPLQQSQNPIQTADLPITIDVQDTRNCLRYAALAVSDIKVKESPFWLKMRLLACGLRPINNIVDITNFLMLELGQPLHAFDYDKIADNKLILRKAKEGEMVKTLDGVNRTLTEGMLVNSDTEKIVGIAGVMGAANSEISSTTQRIILQVENFEMYSIRKTTRELGLRTDASTRFEKGLDPNLVIETMNRAADMIMDLAGGEIASQVIDIYPKPEKKKIIKFDLGKVKRFLGIEIEKKDIIHILNNFGIQVEGKEKSEGMISPGIVKLLIPSFRRDLNIDQDILEEISRIYGYDRIPFDLPIRDLTPVRKNKRFAVQKKIINILASTGSSEVYTYSFVGKELYEKSNLSIDDNLKIRNPISVELAYFKDSLIPSLIEKMKFNSPNFEKQDIFEISKIALKKIDESSKLHFQPKYIGGIYTDKNNNLFRIVKGKLEFLFLQLNIENVNYINLNGKIPFKKAAIFHPRKSALIYTDKEQIGIIGYLHPQVLENFEIKNPCIAFELNFDLLADKTAEKNAFTPIYVYPQVLRALSFWISEDIETKNITDQINSLKIEVLQKISITDIFRNQYKKNKKSITIELILQSPNHTLSEDEIRTAINTVKQSLKKTFKVQIREGEKKFEKEE